MFAVCGRHRAPGGGGGPISGVPVGGVRAARAAQGGRRGARAAARAGRHARAGGRLHCCQGWFNLDRHDQ